MSPDPSRSSVDGMGTGAATTDTLSIPAKEIGDNKPGASNRLNEITTSPPMNPETSKDCWKKSLSRVRPPLVKFCSVISKTLPRKGSCQGRGQIFEFDNLSICSRIR